MEGEEREFFVQDVPIPSKPVKVEKTKGDEVKRSVDEPATSGATSESKKTCALQITEDLDEFVENSNESGEKKPRTISKPTKRIVEAKPVSKGTVVKKKSEPKSLGPMKEEESIPWNGITLNRCLVVAAIAALLSMGFQVLQDVVDTDEDIHELETGHWAPADPNDQQSESWFFEGWFGSSDAEPLEVSDMELSDDELLEEELLEDELPDEELLEDELPEEELPEEELLTEELSEEDLQEEELPELQLPKEEKDQSDQDLPHSIKLHDFDKKTEETRDKHKQKDQWGLKAKNKYMENKAIKIKRQSEGSQGRGVFPFMKKPNDSTKSSQDYKQKKYKEKSHQQKDKERKYEHPKKQELVERKPYKKGKEEENKYFKKEGKENYKGWKEKESKGFKHHQQEKGYKKQDRYHG
ncbi:junctional sarcoplasmic reticulum protein 1 isoform X2 [Bombina bombina]|uniref:junctional sarcoplasmic reticulum protein 1 isoform X2 n=1 Tax=Bombina bombina TaxID=8345 RepID=UPI00235AA230|nr:junctional sarcoplasmic reticulum protein 1 isoform X2 [Bombina bombina]XP_053559047.1 junctional sarcoplasmic reticulum protein 1 isoform X2 [Bombina bombina]